MVKSCCQRSFCTRRGFRLNEHTTTDCLLFPDIFDRPLVAKFDQLHGSSDGGAILLKAAERRLGLTSALAAGLTLKIHDFRNTEGLAMVQIRYRGGFETKSEAFT